MAAAPAERRSLLKTRSRQQTAPPSGPSRNASSHSFHAGAPIPTLASFRRLSTHRYHTFPTPPPKQPRERHAAGGVGAGGGDDDSISDDDDQDEEATPLPVRQLLLLAVLSLAEQTALNSISPYLPNMVASMPGVPVQESGLYVGLVASAFALAQLSTNFMWGYMSDLIGRKPVLLMGTSSLTVCFCFFGLCTRYWQIVVIHVAMGLLNGNAACVPTVLGEVTDRTNQSKAFTYLPIIYSLGSITGPAIGGIMVGRMGSKYPYLGPNVLGAILLAISVVVVAIWFEETLDKSETGLWTSPWLRRISSLVSKTGKRPPSHRSWSSRWPRGQSTSQSQVVVSSQTEPGEDDDELEDDELSPLDEAEDSPKEPDEEGRPWKELVNRTTMLLLATYLIFQLTNIGFNSLYPIFAAAPPPTGRELSPGTIGLSLSVAGVATIVFQAFLFQPIKVKTGNLGTYRLALLGIALTTLMMPWVGYADEAPLFGVGSAKGWLYSELGVVLILKTICAIGGLSSVMLLITNSAPSRASLGTLNGVAQSLSALGRSIGPFMSGGLFTLSTRIDGKGEALVWGLFGGLALLGWLGSLFIRHEGLESDDWVDAESHEEEHSGEAA